MYVNCNTTFHDVGQGLFYTGHIFNENNDFHFAYDCGTDSTRKYIRREIENFKYLVNRSTNKLDLLVLSHFDSDHVNQLDILLNNLQVDTVLIPYLKPIHRLILAIKFSAESDAYYEFLSNPINYFLTRGVRKVIILGGSEPAKEVDFPDNIPELPDNDLLIKLMNDDKLKADVLMSESLEDDKRLIFVKHDGFIFYKNLWFFRFFNRSSSEEELEEFSKLLKSEKYDLSSIDKVVEVITDIEKRVRIKEIYKEIWKINDTSIVMLHGPVKKSFSADNYVSLESIMQCLTDKKYYKCGKRNCYNLYNSYKFNYIDRIYQKRLCSSILFGDIDLNCCYEEIIEHFGKLLNNVLIIQVPHHGSKYSWKPDVLRKINDLSFWIIPFGIFNRHKHPQEIVIADIRKSSPRIVLPNTECHRVVIESTVEW